ncbi:MULTISPECIES: MurR/RpiR family transcriptional regulator [Lactococcus]|uniref:MurR/RpiR family transcriptional regulator n=2 Tax=Lactococcus petauri TaxID=1940789 RepID=A0AAJ2IU68_9LACT|nr:MULTISPECIES: MurR/RpiR family transcriptional regulator [Lactococcus]OAL09451.1 Transcription regulator [Lactococcus garvieae]MBS4459620.1 MurR/RpiR family transcriptional regulator [Lactococcus petauri]MCH1713062.1 MurR/RpiR family transcriptional regulator [Lactococcus petauri]MCI3871135.1 MurR/RpiR family transcriptional regulator [Lactococcus petauri]MCQ8275368.1 N-acetylmuramic acid 6-phosphate etherase [Lactococcus petauri]
MLEDNKLNALNDLESKIFEEVVKAPEIIMNMTIREFASTVHASPTTIVRMTHKLGFSGWNELKTYLQKQKHQISLKAEDPKYDNLLAFELFTKRLLSPEYTALIDEAAKLLEETEYTVFMGVGTSGALADYGTKYFNNAGLPAFEVIDPYQPLMTNNAKTMTVVALSISGKTNFIIAQIVAYKRDGVKVIAITNEVNNTMANMADISIPYNVAHEGSKVHALGNLTTQLPVMAILEQLAHKTQEIRQNKKNKLIDDTFKSNFV